MSDAQRGRSTAYAEVVALVRSLVPDSDAQGALLFAVADYGQDCAVQSIREMATARRADNAKDARLPPRQWGAA